MIKYHSVSPMTMSVHSQAGTFSIQVPYLVTSYTCLEPPLQFLPGGGGESTAKWAVLVCATVQGMVFKEFTQG